MKNFYLLLFSFLSIFSLQAQQCGTQDHTPSERAYFLNTIKNLPVVKNSSTTCIPIKLYVFREDDGSGGVSNEDLNKGLSNLNHKYLEAGIEFYYTAFPSYIDNSDLNNFDVQNPDNDTEAQVITAAGQVTNAVNVYYVQSITLLQGGTPFNAAGYAYFPTALNSSNVILMRHSAAAGSPNGTFTHEFGHYFALPHTFSGTSNGNAHSNAENVPRTGVNANCSTNGDSFCDTDADPLYSGVDFDNATCTHLGTDMDINGVQYNPLTAITNIMSYYSDACVEGFTAEQYTAIAQGFVERQNPANAYNYTASPMSVTAPTGLTATNSGGVVLSWTDNASNEMGYVIERSETSATSGFKSLTEGGTPENATSFTDFTATTPNTTYWFRIKASNGDCNSYSNVATIMITYCPANGATCDEFISRVAINTLDNDNDICSTNGYFDYSAMSTDLTVGTAYPITVENGPNAYSGDQAGVWIDWNQDNDFDDADETITMGGGNFIFTGSVTPPAVALAGPTKMRVRIAYTGALDACGTAQFGEVEDYTINVIAPAFCLDEDFTSFTSGSYQTGNVTIGGQTWTGTRIFGESSGASFGGTGRAVRIDDNTNDAHLTTPSISAPDTVKFQYRELNSGGGTFKVQKSLNGGPFIDVCTQAFTGTTYAQYVCYIGETDPNVEIRILNDNNNGHLIIDNFQIVCGTAVAPPVSDPTVELTASANAGNEDGTTSITLTATASAAVTANETVTLSVTGTNVTGTDYSNAVSITIMNGATTGTTTFDVADDAVNEITEMANVHISALSSGLDSGTVVSQNILITDNDNPTISVPAACSFETASTGGQYTDVSGFDGDTDHDLINNTTEASVDYLYSGAGEIGFDAFFLDGQSSTGLTDGDFVGVSNFTGTVGAYTQGANGYQMSDLDGIMRVVFDPVSLAGFASYNLDLDYFVASTTYEAADFLRIYAIVDGGVELDIINTIGDDVDNLTEGSWVTVNQNLTTYTTAQLIIEGSTNSGTEAFYFDNILFTGSNTPSINISNNNMSGFTYLFGNGASAAQTNTVSWANLVGSVTSLNTVNYFEFSIDAGVSYNPANIALNISIPPFPTTFGPQNVEIRLIDGLTAGIYLDTIYLSTSDGSGGLIGDTVYLAGEVTAPTTPCSELFISEYIEDGGQKYLEIYNPTASAVNLANYDVVIYSNGSSSVSTTINISGSIASGDVFVIKGSSSNAWSGTADLSTGSLNYNGNDAVALRNLGVNVDVIGTIGNSGFFGDDRTLTRLSTVQIPNDTYTVAEWTDTDPFIVTGLGSHTTPCVAVCEISSITAGTQTTCVSATNTYTQELEITSVNTPAGTLIVNGQNFTLTTSPQTITLTNLIADGNPVNLLAVFVANGLCSYSANALFTAPVNCSPTCNITSVASGNQTACIPATNTYTQEVIVNYGNAPGSGTLDVNGQSFAIASSPQTVTLIGLSANGSPVNVTALFSAEVGCTLTSNNLFTAPADCSSTTPCSELFISEYVEDGGQKYLEIYNPTASAVNLTDYDVVIYSNGNTAVTSTINISGSIASGDVFVIKGSGSNAWSGTADLSTGSLNYNGNDAVALRNLGVNVDVIGTIGNSGVFGDDRTLTRLSTIQIPNDTYTVAEWTDTDPFITSGLGFHISDCIEIDYVWTGTTDTDWNTATNWSGNSVPGTIDSITIPDVSGASGNFPIITPAIVLGNVEVKVNAMLTISTGMILDGTLTNNGTVTLQNGAYLDDYTNSGTASYVGDITVERLAAGGTGNSQRFISSAVNAPPVSEIGDDLSGPWGLGLPGTDGVAVTIDDCALQTTAASSNYGNLFSFDETLINTCALDGWVVKSANNLENGVGYSAYIPSNSTFDLTGTPNTGNITGIQINNTASPALEGGWNFIGNPYPSPISRDALVNTFLVQDPQFYVASGPYQGSFAAYNPGENIAIGQGFQVFAPNTNLFAFVNGMRSTGPSIWYSTGAWYEHKLEVSVFGNNGADKTILFYNNDASSNYEAMYDVNKRDSDLGNPTLSTFSANKNLALNGLNITNLGETVPMNFKAGTNGDFSIDANGMETFPSNTTIYLKDILLDVVHNLDDGDYNFTSDVNDAPNRFELIFVPEVDFTINNIDCNGFGGNISPVTNSETRKYDIYSEDGLVAFGALSSMNESLTAGIYNMTLTDIYGGQQDYEFVIDAVEKINAEFNISSNEVSVGEVVFLENNTYNSTSFSWTINNNNILENIEAPTYTFEEAGIYEIVLNVSNETCEDQKTTKIIVFNKTTGIEDKVVDEVSIYPNPIKNKLTIVTDKDIIVKVYSILGELTIESTDKIIDFERVEKGIYFVQIQDDKGNLLLKNKVIKE